MASQELDYKQRNITPLTKLYDKGIIPFIKKRLMSKKRFIKSSSPVLSEIGEDKVSVYFAYYILNYNPSLNEKIDAYQDSFFDEINMSFELLFTQFIELYEEYLKEDSAYLTKKYRERLKESFTQNQSTKLVKRLVNNKKFEDAVRIYFMNNDLNLSDIGLENADIETVLSYFYNDLASLMKSNKYIFAIELKRLKEADIELARKEIEEEIEFITRLKDSIDYISRLEVERYKLINFIVLISSAQIESMESLERVRKLRENSEEKNNG